MREYWKNKAQLTKVSQQTFQRRFNVVFRLIWRRGVAQSEINVETTLCTSTLKFTTLNNVETTLCFSTLNWTTLDNVETTLSFSTSIFTTLGNVETTLRIWPFEKKKASIQKQNNIFELQGICWTQNLLQFFPILRGICKRIFAEPQKFLKHRIYWITKSIFKLSHFVKCQLVFNFKRQVQADYDYHSFNFICIF